MGFRNEVKSLSFRSLGFGNMGWCLDIRVIQDFGCRLCFLKGSGFRVGFRASYNDYLLPGSCRGK